MTFITVSLLTLWYNKSCDERVGVDLTGVIPVQKQTGFMNDLPAQRPDLSGQRQATGSPSNYELFLEALRQGNYPPFCELVWTGEVFYIILQLHFQKAAARVRPPGQEGDLYRREAWNRFRRVKADQQPLLHIRVTVKNWLPVTAEVSIKPEAAGVFHAETSHLYELLNP